MGPMSSHSGWSHLTLEYEFLFLFLCTGTKFVLDRVF